MKPGVVFGFGGGKITKKTLFIILIVLSMTLFGSCANYATNDTQTTNKTNLTGYQETNSTLINNSRTDPENTTTTSENISNSSKTYQTAGDNLTTSNNTTDPENTTTTSENISNSSKTYQAAGDNSTNVQGIWVSTGDVASLNVTTLVEANITDVFVKANLISSPTYQSILTTVIEKLTGTGIRIHAWITCFMDANGDWIDPANETQRTFLLGKITDIVNNYDIDGIHLDYVRYPGTAYDYSNATETITSFVKDVYDTVKSISTEVAVSAALMPEGSVNAYYYGQDYSKIASYLDFLVPMIYKGSYGEDTAWIGSVTKYIVEQAGGTPVLAGLQTYESDENTTAIPADELKSDINSAITNGASGYVLFRYGLIDSAFFNDSVTFTVDQIKDAASRVRAFIETYYRLPNYVEIGSNQVSMSSFLELMTTALLQINSGSNDPISLLTFSEPTYPRDSIIAGMIPKSEYLQIAEDVKNYMDSSGKTPDFAYQTSLGTYLGFQNLVYMYSMILDYHHTSGKIAHWAGMQPWSVISAKSNSIVPDGATFTVDQIKDASSRVRSYIETYYRLPNYVEIGSNQVSMSSFLELMTTALLQINSGNDNSIPERTFSGPTYPRDSIIAGMIPKSEYLQIAEDVKNYMDSSGKTPDFAYQTSLGTYLGFQNLVYMYSMILDYHHTSGKMADWAGMQPWSVVSAKSSSAVQDGETSDEGNSDGETSDGTTFTMDQIKDAASRVRAFIESNQKLPNYVKISTYQVSMSSFLELITTALLQINSGSNDSIPLLNFSEPTNPQDNIVTGYIYKAEYLQIAEDVKNYMDSNGKTPDFAYKTSLGTYLGFENLVYMFSMILDYHNSNGKMADWAGMKPWSVVSGSISSELKQYLATTSNCEVTNSQIQSLAASITSSKTSTYDKAVAIFNWVRNNISYSFYYNTTYGAVGTLNAGTGNCVDTTHLLIALYRAAEIPAKYVHGYCKFSSGNWYGHVWAQVYVDGNWYTADAISSSNSFGVIKNWNTNTATIYNTYASLPF